MTLFCLALLFAAALTWRVGPFAQRPARWQREPLRVGVKAQPRAILVTGATGFIGRHLCRHIVASGDRLIVVTRNAARVRDLFGPHATVYTSFDDIDPGSRIDAIVNLAGAPIFARRWTQQRRQELLESRLNVTNGIAELIARLQSKPGVLVSASAVGYYGIRGDEELTENDRARPIFQSQLCQMWELAAQKSAQRGVRVCRLRLGMVLGRDGGALPQQILAARCGIRTRLGSGQQWISWIHLADVLRLIDCCIDRDDLDGVLNATAPVPVRQQEFAAALAQQCGPAFGLSAPARLLRWLLGERSQLLLDGQRVVPLRARCSGFEFAYPTIDRALADLTQQIPAQAPSEVVYDSLCPVCDTEMTAYCRSARRAGHMWRFDDVAQRPDLMARFGLDLETARKRVYVLDDSGAMISGMEALTAIWGGLPHWRFLGWLMRLPLVKPAAAWFYDTVLAPLIWRWNQRRRAALHPQSLR